MPIANTNNIVYAFLTEPRFSIGRHFLLLVMLIGYTSGQSMYLFDNHTGELKLASYVYTASLSIVNILFTYFNIYYLAPHFLLRNRYLTYFIILFTSISLLLVGKYAVEYGISLSLGMIRAFSSVTLLVCITEIIFMAICVLSSLIPFLLRVWIKDSKQIVDIEGREFKSSIEKLKGQINPDFLFEIIQYASEEVKREPHKASELMMCLSELLRYELYDCKREKVILRSNIDFVRNYLSLSQQVSGNISYSISVEGNMNQFVHPFLFMPFIQEMLRQCRSNILLHYVINKNTVTLACSNEEGLLESKTINIQPSK